jgi:AcrR family transcriptional regulator
MISRQRAVRDEQKQERRQTILDTAWMMFQESSYEAVTIAGVAEAAGLAKGTVYLYFKTKEELFLSIQEQQLAEWFDEVDTHLEEVRSNCTVPQVVSIISNTLTARPGLTRLLAILHIFLEQNVDFATALRFKQMLLAHLSRTGPLLEQCLPFLTPGGGAHLLLRSHALVIGLQHLSDPAPIIRNVLQEPGLQIFIIDFAREFSDTLEALLYGLETAGEVNKHRPKL